MTHGAKILYWPGRGKSPDVLSSFLSALRDDSVSVDIFPFEYDTGQPPFRKDSAWSSWIGSNPRDWWIGISLGASLAYMMAALLEINMRPKRLTLINPFQSRKILSVEKNFSLQNQWDFSPISHNLIIEEVDMVISVNDEKIPAYHGIKLLDNIICDKKNLILIEAGHCIDNHSAQEILASVLLEGAAL
jgi:hypothetical protein